MILPEKTLLLGGKLAKLGIPESMLNMIVATQLSSQALICLMIQE